AKSTWSEADASARRHPRPHGGHRVDGDATEPHRLLDLRVARRGLGPEKRWQVDGLAPEAPTPVRAGHDPEKLGRALLVNGERDRGRHEVFTSLDAPRREMTQRQLAPPVEIEEARSSLETERAPLLVVGAARRTEREETQRYA